MEKYRFIDDLTSDVMFEASAEGKIAAAYVPSTGLLPGGLHEVQVH